MNWSSHNSGILTVLSNRVGDGVLFVFLFIFIMYNKYSMFTSNTRVLILVVLVLVTFTKSAQFPFSSWLPFAMAAPTPISALVHSSTLVASGVILVVLFLPFVRRTSTISIMFLVALITMLYSGVFSLLEKDFKKMVALSTLNQLAFLFLRLRVGLQVLGFFHLCTHALFKRLLFLGVGHLLHHNFSAQDARVHITSNNILVRFSVLVRLFNLTGVLFRTGILSKDLLIEVYMRGYKRVTLIMVYRVGLVFTMLYSFRILSFIVNPLTLSTITFRT
jgi:NADH-ubiquinone oxidoreductase chain 5